MVSFLARKAMNQYLYGDEYRAAPGPTRFGKLRLGGARESGDWLKPRGREREREAAATAQPAGYGGGGDQEGGVRGVPSRDSGHRHEHLVEGVRKREFVIDNLLVRIRYIIVMIRWTGLAPWEFLISRLEIGLL